MEKELIDKIFGPPINQKYKSVKTTF